MSERLTQSFVDCQVECAGTPTFVETFNRLTGCHLTSQSAPDSADVQAFAAFVDGYVWQCVLATAAWTEALEDH